MPNQIVTKTTLTRPSINVRFSAGNPLWTNYLQKVYVESGKMLAREVTVSEDKLTRYMVIVWPNEETRQEYLNDPMTKIALDEEKNHRKTYGIEFSWENQEMDGDTVVRSWSGGEAE